MPRREGPQGRETDLACGAVVTNLCAAARAFGLAAEVSWRPAADVAAEVTLRPAPDQAAPDPTDRARLQALRRRAMNRSLYRPDPVPGTVIDGLQATAKRLGFTLSVLTGPAGIDRMAALAGRAGVMKLTHAPTQAELHALMRFTPGAAARERDGLDLELFFTPAATARLAAVATHPRVLTAAAPLHVAEMVVRDSDVTPLRSAPALCLLFAEALDAETFLRGGACFEEIALDVTEAGLAMALHSAPVEVGLSHPGPLPPSVPGSAPWISTAGSRSSRPATGMRPTRWPSPASPNGS